MLTKRKSERLIKVLDGESTSFGFFICKVERRLHVYRRSSCGLEGKTKTPAGKAEQMRPRRSASDEEAHRPPRKAKSCTGNPQRCHKRFTLAL